MTNTIEIISQFGGEIYSHEDGLLINGLNSLHGAKLYCDSDHRMTMLAGIASLISEEEVVIPSARFSCIPYSHFWPSLLGSACRTCRLGNRSQFIV